MSKSRQRPDRAHVRAVAIIFSSGYRWSSTGSEWAQLVRATPGMIRVRIGDSHFVVAPHQAVWIPAGVAHDTHLSGRGTLVRVYLRPWRGSALPRAACVLAFSPLLREVVRRTLRHTTLDRTVPVQRHLADLLVDELAVSPAAPLELPIPTDPRARRAAELLRDAPSTAPATLAREAHASLRTLERLFRAESGMSLGAWRRRARLMRALSLLADGASVTATGLAVGYGSTSSFVSAFREALGTTPGQYFRQPATREDDGGRAASPAPRGAGGRPRRRP